MTCKARAGASRRAASRFWLGAERGCVRSSSPDLAVRRRAALDSTGQRRTSLPSIRHGGAQGHGRSKRSAVARTVDTRAARRERAAHCDFAKRRDVSRGGRSAVSRPRTPVASLRPSVPGTRLTRRREQCLCGRRRPSPTGGRGFAPTSGEPPACQRRDQAKRVACACDLPIGTRRALVDARSFAVTTPSEPSEPTMRCQSLLFASLFAVTACSAASTGDGSSAARGHAVARPTAGASGRSAPPQALQQAAVPDMLPGLSGVYRSCIATSPDIPQRGECAEDEIARQDRRLNKAYAALRSAAKQHPDQFDEAGLVRSQRAWLINVTEGCNASMLRFGSDAGPTTLAECRMHELAHRASQLERWLQEVTHAN